MKILELKKDYSGTADVIQFLSAKDRVDTKLVTIVQTDCSHSWYVKNDYISIIDTVQRLGNISSHLSRYIERV